MYGIWYIMINEQQKEWVYSNVERFIWNLDSFTLGRGP